MNNKTEIKIGTYNADNADIDYYDYVCNERDTIQESILDALADSVTMHQKLPECIEIFVGNTSVIKIDFFEFLSNSLVTILNEK